MGTNLQEKKSPLDLTMWNCGSVVGSYLVVASVYVMEF